MRNFAWFALAAVLELSGCYALWIWLRLGRSPWWLGPAVLCLVAFGVCLTRVDAPFAGRVFAAYAGVYLLAALTWYVAVEQVRPDRWDWIGATITALGALVILLGPR